MSCGNCSICLYLVVVMTSIFIDTLGSWRINRGALHVSVPPSARILECKMQQEIARHNFQHLSPMQGIFQRAAFTSDP
jgi:hypothetical protein